MLNKAKHKNQTDSKIKAKPTSYAKTKHKKREESDRITWSPFPSTSWKNFSFD